MAKIDKSWAVTLSSIIIAITMIILPSFGIENITESQVSNLIYMALGISTVGAGNKVAKRIVQKKTISEIKETTNSYSHKWYNVDFIKTQKGNGITYGTQFLTISSNKVRSYFTVVLRDSNNTVIDANQGNKISPVLLNLHTKLDGKYIPFARGKYTLKVTGDYGSSDSVSVTDEFEIV